MTRRLPLVALASVLLASPLAAQVGFPTTESPFRDLEYRQSMTLYSGYYHAATDEAGVAPQGGPLVGARYDIALGGPASLTARVASVFSERRVIDPARPAGTRELGIEQRPLFLADVGITLGLTGQKSWHGFVPTIHGGGGLATNFSGDDPGGFRFGTRFAIAYGAGMRYVPQGRPWSLRFDLGSHMYQIRYPDRYFTVGLDSTAVLRVDASKSSWTNNWSGTVGVSYQFFR